MKVCIAGEWCWDFYEKSLSNAFKYFGCETIQFQLNSAFKNFKYRDIPPVYNNFSSKLQYHFKMGPKVIEENNKLIKCIEYNNPDILFLYNTQLILPKTLLRLKNAHPNLKVFQYSQDCAFSENHKMEWRHFRQCIPCVDCNFTVRKSDVSQFRKAGSKSTQILEQFYDPYLDYPLNRDQIPSNFLCDVVFAGHYEDDLRSDVLEQLVRHGVDVRLYGGGWNYYNNKKSYFDVNKVKPAIDREYQQAICGAKVALAFLSKLNNDNYTTRNFQIPALGVPMVAEASDDLANFFTRDSSVLFFKTADEAVEKTLKLLSDVDKRENMIKNAKIELNELKMSSLDRAHKILEIYKCMN